MAEPAHLILNSTLLSEQIYAGLRQQILAGDYAPGQRLNESEMARRMGVSQAPVRDALGRLVESGLARRVPRRGTFVEGVSPKAAADAYHVRVALEPLAVRELLPNVDEQLLDNLRSNVDAMVAAALDGDLARLLEHDIAFHRIIWWGSQNELLPKVWPLVEKIWPLLEARVRNSADRENRLFYRDLEEVARTHEPLVAALADGNPETPALFLSHVTQVWSRVESLGTSSDPTQWAVPATPDGDKPG